MIHLIGDIIVSRLFQCWYDKLCILFSFFSACNLFKCTLFGEVGLDGQVRPNTAVLSLCGILVPIS